MKRRKSSESSEKPKKKKKEPENTEKYSMEDPDVVAMNELRAKLGLPPLKP